jgi:alpha-N-arabinofuranosidase
LDYPIVGTGHADLVEAQNGEWWLVCLAMRPYGGYFYNLGRETFLVPVRWEEDWPIVNPGIGKVEFETPVPNLPEHRWVELPARDEFDGPTLAFHWNSLRTLTDDFATLTERPGYLRLRLRPERLSEETNPSFIGRRQQHIHFRAETVLEFIPKKNEHAGLALIQNHNFHYLFVVTQLNQPMLQLIRRAYGTEELLAEHTVTAGTINMKIEAHEQSYNFYFAEQPNEWRTLAENVDGRILSTPIAGGFVGVFIGLYASSNGQPSANHADFDWFEYNSGIDQLAG